MDINRTFPTNPEVNPHVSVTIQESQKIVEDTEDLLYKFIADYRKMAE